MAEGEMRERALERFEDCPTRLDPDGKSRKYPRCRCEPVCAVCGYRKHDAIHCPHPDDPQKPYGCAFRARKAMGEGYDIRDVLHRAGGAIEREAVAEIDEARAALRLALPLLVDELQTVIESAWALTRDGEPVKGFLEDDDPNRELAANLIAAIRAIEPIIGQCETRKIWLRRIIDAGATP